MSRVLRAHSGHLRPAETGEVGDDDVERRRQVVEQRQPSDVAERVVQVDERRAVAFAQRFNVESGHLDSFFAGPGSLPPERGTWRDGCVDFPHGRERKPKP